MKDEVEALMRMGADVAKMTYKCKKTNTRRAVITAKNMRESYVQDGGTFNIKCIHWIFYELPYSTHRDVLTRRRSHMDEVVDKVERAMNITWAPRRPGETNSHKNCLQLAYAKVLNDKRQTIIKEKGTSHKRRPLVKHPRTAAEAKHVENFKRGKMMFYWKSKAEGEHFVSTERIWVCYFFMCTF